MQIYADPITVNCRKVLAGLKLMQVPYELVHVDYFKAEQKSDSYTAINPNASLPAMKDGDFILWESNAILMYAADKHRATAHYPTDLQTRSDIQRWLLWESSSWFPSCYVYLVENCVKPLLGGAADPAILEAQLQTFHKLAGILEARLASHKWLAGTAQPPSQTSPLHRPCTCTVGSNCRWPIFRTSVAGCLTTSKPCPAGKQPGSGKASPPKRPLHDAREYRPCCHELLGRQRSTD